MESLSDTAVATALDVNERDEQGVGAALVGAMTDASPDVAPKRH